MKKYVKEYKGHKVPEGATHYQHSSNYYYEAFLIVGNSGKPNSIFFVDNEGNSYFCDDLKLRGWMTIGEKLLTEVCSSLIPLPEAEQEWMPEVGYICEVKESVVGGLVTEWSKVYVDSINIKSDSSIQVCCIDDNGDFAIFYPAYDSVEFRPLKTQEQKDREAFIDKALEEIETKAGLVAPDKAIFEIMHEAGFTAPKAGDNE